MIVVHHLESSRSERVIWLLEELGLAYELRRFGRGPDHRAPPEFRALHPLARAPMITDGDFTMIESGAIMEYIINRHAGGRLGVAVASPDYGRYLQWMHFAEGSAITQFVLQLYLSGFIPGVDQSSPFVQQVIQGNTQLLELLDRELSVRPYFVGDAFTAADIMMAFCFRLARDYLKTDMALYPNLKAWLDRVETRPAYIRAMEIANPPANPG